MGQLSGSLFLSQWPPPVLERLYRALAVRQPWFFRSDSQMAWGSGRTRTWSPQRSSFSPPPQSSSS